MNIPGATYRLQFHGQFTLKNAYDIIEYLASLGITDIYASPVLAAKTGSAHGYDAIDPSCINPEIGTAEDFQKLVSRAKEKGIGWVQDIVPNHMSFSPENKMILDVLENGVESRYAGYFDIDWHHPYQGLTGKLLAPFLGKFYGDCLESGELVLEYDGDGFKIRYFETVFPVSIESYDMILSLNLGRLKRTAGAAVLFFAHE
jgi:(1->4)-alpha-D-glucan 1-alpha-D-glucosylmutase